MEYPGVIAAWLLWCLSAQAAYMRNDGQSEWPVSESGPLLIDVCFEDLSEPSGWTPPVAMASLREWVADGVKSTWGRHGRIVFRFDMTTPCSAIANANSFVRIGWSDTHPFAQDVGSNVRGIPSGVTVARWKTLEQTTDCPGGEYERCTKADAIHEFGHVLGFFHEEESPDRQFSSLAELGRECDTNFDGGVILGNRIGAYDLSSVMSPCGRAYKAFPWTAANRWSTDVHSNTGRKVELSVNDIAALQHVYGRHQPGTLMSEQRCLSAHWFTAGSTGNYPFTHDCDENWDGQEWSWWVAGTGMATFAVVPNLGGGSTAYLDGFHGTWNPVEIRSSSVQANPFWTTVDAAIVGFGGMCLDVWGGSTSSVVKMAPCAGGLNPPDNAALAANQRWNVDRFTGKIGSLGLRVGEAEPRVEA